jgi:ankyrin repeat protein
MRQSAKLTILLILLAFSACISGKQLTRSADTDQLFLAVRSGKPETVRSLLAIAKPDVNGRDDNGNTPLMVAAQNGHDEIASTLLAAKADVHAKNKQGQTALDLAIAGGHDDCVRLLKAAGG